MLINDQRPDQTIGNVRYIKMDLDQLSKLVSQRLNMEIFLKNSWKINEVKPFLGLIFEPMLTGYDFWGWCDNDLIWGDIRRFLTDDLLDQLDMLSSREKWTTGHFTLIRNKRRFTELPMRYNEVSDLLNDPSYRGFEECAHRWEGEYHDPAELRAKGQPVSLYDLVRHAHEAGTLRARFIHLVREYPDTPLYHYRDGKWYDLKTGEEFMYYHMIVVKKIWRFYIPQYSVMPRELFIDNSGIRSGSEAKWKWTVRKAAWSFFRIISSVRKQSTQSVIKKFWKELTFAKTEATIL